MGNERAKYMIFKHYVNIKKQHLLEYHYSVGGGMTGGYYSETVRRQGDKAVISTVRAEFHNEEPIESKIEVDASILDDIEQIVRKYKMNFWNKRKFTNMFISDGESTSYTFSFDKTRIYFSSQFYPAMYGMKLQEIRDIIKKYQS